ncbi:MAG: hypothetical protein ACJAS4_002583 [Bacteriovoracaceae bacterium]|jgi:hypothetical protein
MKSLKRLLLGTTLLGTVAFFVLGSMNSIVVDKQAFLRNDLNITFAKRLDEMNGDVVIGRMAASIPKWDNTKSLAPIKKINKITKKVFITKKSKLSIVKNIVSAAPGPTVKNAPDLELTGGLFNKKPLKDGKGYSGKAHIVDGVIEEINVTLPGGKQFIINTNERMVGNVFQYEDTETREMRSGLFYEVKKGQYMITLTDDTKFAGLRLEFKSEAGTEVKSKNNNSNWAMNDQNVEENDNLDVNNFTDDSHEAYEVEDQKDAYAARLEEESNEMNNEEYENNIEEENYDDNEMVRASSFGFNFNS